VNQEGSFPSAVHGGIAHLTSGQVAPAEGASAPPTPAIASSTMWNDELLVNKLTCFNKLRQAELIMLSANVPSCTPSS
jgi:hypothetical protein